MDVKQAASAYNAIANIGQTALANDPKPVQGSGESFSAMLTSALGSAVDAGNKAESISTLAVMGKADITEMTTAISAAERSLNTVVAIRDKVVSAYQQIMQMPV